MLLLSVHSFGGSHHENVGTCSNHNATSRVDALKTVQLMWVGTPTTCKIKNWKWGEYGIIKRQIYPW